MYLYPHVVCIWCCLGDPGKLNLTTPMYRIARVMANPASGLEVKDRVWLKMTIPKSFIGKPRRSSVGERRR